MQRLLMLTAVDVRRATESGNSRATTIDKMTIPSIEFMTANHTPGGGNMSVDFVLPRIVAPEPAFSVKGIDTDIFGGMGTRDQWTFASAYRDKKTNKAVPARGLIDGVIMQWEPDESDPSEFQGCNHMFKEVLHFEFTLDGEELFYVDFEERVMRIKGVDLFAEERNALGA